MPSTSPPAGVPEAHWFSPQWVQDLFYLVPDLLKSRTDALSQAVCSAKQKAQRTNEKCVDCRMDVLEPGSSPHHVDTLLAGAEEPAVALVTGAGSISTDRRA